MADKPEFPTSPDQLGMTRSRRFLRYEIDVRATVTISDDDGLKKLSVRTIDIAEGGMALVCPVDLPTNSSLQIEVKLPETGDVLKIRGLVRNRSGFRFGIEFLRIRDDQQRIIRQYCRHAKLSGS
ncbi:MAG TPA: PilZ domain-containing protein [candidate division Zixibacteria bacterium]|nr:PilZ domain-containing protein [candidate division Zixibacteria bacterium]